MGDTSPTLPTLSQLEARSPRGASLSFRPPKHVIEQRAEVGFDDVEFTPSQRDGLRHIVQDLQSGLNGGRPTPYRTPGRRLSTALLGGSIVRTQSGTSIRRPSCAKAVLSAPDRVNLSSRCRMGFPPHRKGQASVTHASSLTGGIPCCLARRAEARAGSAKNWSSLSGSFAAYRIRRVPVNGCEESGL